MRPPCTQPDRGRPCAIQDGGIANVLSAICRFGRETGLLLEQVAREHAVHHLQHGCR